MMISTYDEAVAFVNARIGQGVKPGLERISGLLTMMGDPHAAYPIVHVAGTNGKSTTVRMVSDILGAHGLRVGSFVSPHLTRVEERYALAGVPFDADQFASAVADVAPFVEIYEDRTGESITYFELTAAIGFSACADAAVDVAVIEVGLGGRWDATNVVSAAVSVITGIAMDHMSYLGDSLSAIAAEKAAILKEGGVLVTGELPAAAEGPVTAQVAETGSRWIRYGTDFGLGAVEQAVGGWVVDLEGLFGDYGAVYLPLHGRHQTRHLLTAVVAAEALFQRPLDDAALRSATEASTSPGRLEVVRRHPLVLLDGAHNTEGLVGLASTLDEEFPGGRWTLVVGMRGERSPDDLLAPLRGRVGSVIATAPVDEHAIHAHTIAEAARRVFGPDVPVTTVEQVPEAVRQAIDAAGESGQVAVTGSLYVVGEARRELLPRGTALPTGVHVRIEAVVEDEEADVEWEQDDDEYGEAEDFGSDSL